MALFLSPGVVTEETDATLSTTAQSDKIAAIAGAFQWGPVNEPVLVTTGEDELVAKFGPPNDASAKFMMPALDFTSYSKTLLVVRQIGTNGRNAFPLGETAQLIENDNEFLTANLAGIDFISKYAGSLGNGLGVSIAASGTDFDNWEFQNAFSYRPTAGEYAIAVLDTSGAWTGAGANKQKERLVVTGTAAGGVQQKQTITVTGTATGGVAQEETLTFTGTATGTSITVNGTVVTIAVNDTASVVAGKVATALAAITATYSSAVATNNTVHVVFAVPAANQTAIAGATAAGITFSSVITIAGNDAFNITVYGETVGLTYGDTAIVAAGKIYAVFAAKPTLYSAVNQPTTSKVQYTFVAYGVQTVTATQTISGLTLATVADTPGSDDLSITVFGVTVALKNNDTASQVATKIAATAGFIALFDSVVSYNSAVTYVAKEVGYQAIRTAPGAQSGLTFDISLTDAGRTGTILEKYELMTADPTAKNPDGTTAYWRDAINNSSSYVRACDKNIALTTRTVNFAGGVDDYNVNTIAGWQLLSDSAAYQLQYLISPDVTAAEQKAIIDLSDTRADCQSFVAPAITDVVNNRGNELASVLDWRNNRLNKDSTYAFSVDNWGYMYDKYNDVYRWVPATGGTAGLAARCAVTNDPWISFAGFARGMYKNYAKMAWSAGQDTRDQLYKVGVNSIVTFPGQGIVLFGDKTMTSRPTAFSRTNVRWAFIATKLTLQDLAKYFLFENNNAFTRAQFVNAARPYLRNMVARHAFQDFQIVMDERNNDGAVQAENKMIGQIMLKPEYSVNWVVLNLTAVRPDVAFSTVELTN